MKFDFIDENDEDIRSVLKTFPWGGIGFTVFIGYIFVDTLLSQVVKMRDGYSPITFEIESLSVEQHPAFFITILLLEAVILACCVAYVSIRISIRRRLMREDKV
ncbi:MAG: hypothetical protein JKY71_01285 [Alphaproteobacteria bacterium]|nr:hypothetical protein [Alphaproteobacteria bacterium]